ncbi:peroxisome assembly protein 26-like isoform X2 [Saccostrea echinata]|uniref:peroxisome assembly protein 26-like isoform X2 n=1 Tax=Saccostrea echinata TaxID=191078 RepID=UPI002A835905|nr:peroxisome assembly protein 26-like isoform X2 [Saccostrea echinata]
MASMEVPHPKENYQTGLLADQATLKQYLDNATAALLFKNFDACIENCENGLSRVKLCSELENFSAKEYIERLCVLAVQAHAERNTWQEVLPFVQKVYSDIEHSPAAVLQLCLLLYARLQDYPQCQALANIWLRNQENYTDPEYPHIVDIYVQHAMFPRKLHSLVPAFLDTCHGLTASQKQQMMQHYATSIENELKSVNEENAKGTTSADKNVVREDDNGEPEGVWAYIKRLSALLFQRIKPYSLSAIISVAVILLAFLSLRFNKGFRVQSYCCGND